MANDRVKVTVTPAGRRVQWLLASALALLALAAVVVFRTMRREDAAMQAVLADSRKALSAPTPVPAPEAARPPATPEQPPHLRARADRPEAKSDEQTFTLNAPGERAGLAAFPPPGTKPIKRGIIVPEGFELPEGYVRHYQTTDDGRRLPPILMFHPDYEGVDAAGNPIALPEDRIVPPEMVPPGMPVERLEDVEHAGGTTRAGGTVDGTRRPAVTR
jgi:hypothetical protein